MLIIRSCQIFLWMEAFLFTEAHLPFLPCRVAAQTALMILPRERGYPRNSLGIRRLLHDGEIGKNCPPLVHMETLGRLQPDTGTCPMSIIHSDSLYLKRFMYAQRSACNILQRVRLRFSYCPGMIKLISALQFLMSYSILQHKIKH